MPFFQTQLTEAGCDEAGRGCLAGPVFAAAVILAKDFGHPLLNDSKQMTPEDRYALRKVIEKEAICFAIAAVDNQVIDRINILKASLRAMHMAVSCLATRPGLLLVDGNRFTPYPKIPHECIVRGDELYASIAAASVLAKTYRDEFMMDLHDKFPCYCWNVNKGYPTLKHRNAIRQHGITPFHRMTFRLLPDDRPGTDS